MQASETQYKMTGILAQLITITSHGNQYLSVGSLTNFFPENSSFQHCNSVQFSEMRKGNFFSFKKKEYILVDNPIEWFKLLKNDNCKKLRLYYQTQEENDHKIAGFVGGGGSWSIECIYKDYSDFWISKWDFDKELESWKVTYEKVIAKHSIINKQYNLKQTKSKLKNVLEQITEFAYKETTENWGGIFEKAKKTIESENPEIDFYHNDLIVKDNYNLENRQLLMSASKAFVFGGMGSWNDIYIENQEIENKYNSLSSELYQLMMVSILCAINGDKIENAHP